MLIYIFESLHKHRILSTFKSFENFYQTKASFNVKYVKTSFKQYTSSNKQTFIFQRLIIPRHLVQQLYYLSR